MIRLQIKTIWESWRWCWSSHMLKLLLMFTWVPCQWLSLLPLFQRAALRTFINMTRGTFGLTRFLSHDIIGWSWQAPTSCLKRCDFTGRLDRLNTPSTLTVGPCKSKSTQLHLHHKSPVGTKIWEISQVSKRHAHTHIYKLPVVDLGTLFNCEFTVKNVSTPAVIKPCKWWFLGQPSSRVSVSLWAVGVIVIPHADFLSLFPLKVDAGSLQPPNNKL